MDLDQLQKRLEWLEGERRKDKSIIDTLERRIAAYEGIHPRLEQELKDVNGEVVRLSMMMVRLQLIQIRLLTKMKFPTFCLWAVITKDIILII